MQIFRILNFGDIFDIFRKWKKSPFEKGKYLLA